MIKRWLSNLIKRRRRRVLHRQKSPKARFPFKRNRLRCVRCVNENRKKLKRLRWQAANHGCHCFDRAFLLDGACANSEHIGTNRWGLIPSELLIVHEIAYLHLSHSVDTVLESVRHSGTINIVLCCSPFHRSTTRWEKKKRRTSSWLLDFMIFAVWPSVLTTGLMTKSWLKVKGI